MLKSYHKINVPEAGCDEAGRGCLAGPVFAAAVILPKNFKDNSLNDSKKLSEKERYRLRPIIEENALSFAIAMLDHVAIDKINILNASIKAMHLALDKLSITPENIIIDGNRFKPYKAIPYQCMVKGDARFYSIAAASVLAKTYRDDYMNIIHQEFPQYNWVKNKGYPTLEHRKAVLSLGISTYHRKTFTINNQQLRLFE
ncbi:MAG: ribonuclease HII [Bacteroidia bacterium]|nr:ribonuclease HII [Bacteroidia bacterium]